MTTADARTVGLLDRNPEDETDGALLLDDVEHYLARFVIYPSGHERRAHALWIAHTWLTDQWESTPRIAFLSPEPGSGKSRALEVTEPVVPRSVHSVNTSPAYLFRKVSDPDGLPTILYDEIDTVFGPKAKDNEEIRGMINAGHRKGATAGRCVMTNGTVTTEDLPAYCAVALAGLDDLPDTIMSRSLVVRMRRRAPGEKVEPWRLRINGPEAEKLKERLAVWSAGVAAQLAAGDFWPQMPEGVEDRDADVREPLLTVADLVGGHWPIDSRLAAKYMVTASRQTRASIGMQLLTDIRTVFDKLGVDKLLTEQLIRELCDLDESPWRSVRKGEPLDPRGLAMRLGKYGIGSKSQRDGEQVFKGYNRAQFEDAWSRYSQAPAGDEPTPADDAAAATTLAEPVAPSSASVTPVTQSSSASGVTDVTDKSGSAVREVPAELPAGEHCRYCHAELPPHMSSQCARGYCTSDRPRHHQQGTDSSP